MRFVAMALVLTTVMMSMGCGIEGLNNANPKTIIRFNGSEREMYLYNNKDVDLSLVNPKFDGNAKTFSADTLTISDKASSVREANYQQLIGLATQATANWNGAIGTVNALVGVVKAAAPFLTPALTGAMLSGLPPGTLTAAQIQAILSSAGTATQPAQ